MLEQGKIDVENAYSRLVTFEGNRSAQAVINQVFTDCDQKWRGIGVIPASGWRLRPEFEALDAELRFPIENIKTGENPLCIAGQILQGLKKPQQCSAFGTICTPEHPLGATMVSAEGTCAAYYRFSRDRIESVP
jgi:hydrogenase expression/formation protein HypD